MDLTLVVRHGVAHPWHPCARILPSGRTKQRLTGTQPPPRVLQMRLGAPLRPPCHVPHPG
jgi:hypothetical protein